MLSNHVKNLYHFVNVFFTPPLEPDCESKPERGPCKAATTRFYFDKKENSCKKFTYGGCKGNGNNYETEDECLETCFNPGIPHYRTKVELDIQGCGCTLKFLHTIK